MGQNANTPNQPLQRLSRDQIATTGDLLALKNELIDEIKNLLKGRQNSSQKPWLKSADVRKMLNISDGTLQTLRINGTIPYTKIGGAIYYAYEDIVTLLEENRVHNR
ncbi:helix-turn-helix domain-containing protein [Acetobacteroides hydrogenigenes]|uniref:Helix-turn-helix protein n=1 Tax=Acetobacteroides hydrogenigenes TaxID=979970 RepID=A0A4R2E0U6_9BACT|nr:helix-turn-helix domain-containing protein [Acetobacteroides hydrogenigenes]TCN60436.1 helix-turn-helix protein [Acetobacteroides hydrogenigenes]